MSEAQKQLTLKIKAHDEATGTLAKVTHSLEQAAHKFKNSGLNNFKKAFGEFAEHSGIAKAGEALKEVGAASLEVGKEFAKLGLEAGFVTYEILEQFSKIGATLAHTADRVGLTVDEFASLQFAAKKAGIDTETFTGAIDSFNRSVGQAKAGTGKLYSFLGRVSPVLRGQVVGAKSTGAALDLMWKAMVKLQDPAKRAAFAAAAFGKDAGPKMAAMVKGGTEELEEQRKKFLHLAGSQEALARNSEKLEEAMVDAKTAFMGLASGIVTQFMPVFTELSDTLAEFFAEHRDELVAWAQGAAQAFKEWIAGGGLDRLIATLKDIFKTVGDMIEKVGGLKTVFAGLGLIVAGPLISSLFGLVGALVTIAPLLFGIGAAVGPVLLALSPFLVAAGAVALAGYRIYESWGGIKQFFVDLWAGITDAFTGNFKTIKPIMEGIANFMSFGAFGAIKDKLGFGGPDEDAIKARVHANLTGAGAAAAARPPPVQSTQANVSVSFDNLPKGARVTQDANSSQPVDLSMGYSMATP